MPQRFSAPRAWFVFKANSPKAHSTDVSCANVSEYSPTHPTAARGWRQTWWSHGLPQLANSPFPSPRLDDTPPLTSIPIHRLLSGVRKQYLKREEMHVSTHNTNFWWQGVFFQHLNIAPFKEKNCCSSVKHNSRASWYRWKCVRRRCCIRF